MSGNKFSNEFDVGHAGAHQLLGAEKFQPRSNARRLFSKTVKLLQREVKAEHCGGPFM